MFRRSILAACSAALIAAGCASSGDDEVTTSPTDPGTTITNEAPVSAPPATAPDYAAEAAALPQATSDASLPDLTPDTPVGAYGFSRYVYSQADGEVIPMLVEGPLGAQTRCQEADQQCSYQELKELYDSGVDVPDYLGMDRETLGELVGQLDRVSAAIGQYETIDDACAAGFFQGSNQTANMGIHMYDLAAGNEFNPDRPQMVLFARDGGEVLGAGDLGRCDDGGWTGEDGYVPVGAVFNLTLTEDHPDGFAGPIDNWHIHYNTCAARSDIDLGNLEGVINPEGTTTEQDCLAAGGQFYPVVSSWMMHAYVAPEFDAQGGVFAMFNNAVSPTTNSLDDIRDQRSLDTEGAVDAPIINFDFGEIEAGVGEPIVFANADSVPHTVTSGSALDPTSDFDSGVLGTGQSYELSFDQAGEYPLFCVLHPEMQATVTVQ